MKVGDVCRREVYVVVAEQPLVDAAQEMHKRHVGALVVVDATSTPMHPMGIITDRDIVCGQWVQKADLHCLTVADVMTREPWLLAEVCDLSEAIALMCARGVRRAPVVNSGGDLVGIVTLDDLLPAVAAELNALAKLIGTQARKEPER